MTCIYIFFKGILLNRIKNIAKFKLFQALHVPVLTYGSTRMGFAHIMKYQRYISTRLYFN